MAAVTLTTEALEPEEPMPSGAVVTPLLGNAPTVWLACSSDISRRP